MEKVEDISNEPYGEYISSEFEHHKAVKVNFPGGMIKRIREAFNNQISENGIFINGEVAVFEDSERDHALSAYGTSGDIGKYKVEDYLLAKRILEEEANLKVEIYSLNDFVDTFLESDWREHNEALQIKNIENTKSNCIMKIERLKIED